MQRLWIIFLLPLLASCMEDHTGLQKVVLSSGTRTLTLWVEIADDPSEQAEGLMGRTELGDDRGMLFIFPDSRPLNFWMKNTLIPLDILFFDAGGEFVSMRTMDPCKIDPCQGYPSDGSAKYALEVEAGFASREGVGEGWRIEMK